MNQANIKKLCGFILGGSLLVVALLLLEDYQRARTFGGPMSAEQGKLLRIAGFSAFTGWLIPIALPFFLKIKDIIFPGASSSSELNSLIGVLNTIASLFGINLSIGSISDLLKAVGLPLWFYVGWGLQDGRDFAGGYGPVPKDLPPPPGPPPATKDTKVVIVNAIPVADPAKGAATP